jgi:hypothetical protein
MTIIVGLCRMHMLRERRQTVRTSMFLEFSKGQPHHRHHDHLYLACERAGVVVSVVVVVVLVADALFVFVTSLAMRAITSDGAN